jgi:glycosyltransferase involved in cell wall biosynthesis
MSDRTTKAPLVSVCVPTYNGAAYLKECLASIQAQTFGDFEVVITDDASGDETIAIATEFARRDGRFRIHPNHQRLGLVGNWNQSIRLARGEWIKLVFQDDLLLPDCLERMVAVAQRGNFKFLTCRRDFKFEADTTPETRAFYVTHAADIDRFFSESKTCQPDDFAKAILESVGANFIGEPTTTLIHRSVFDRCGMFNENLIMRCDSEYWYRAGTHVPVTFVAETLAVFRVHGASTSAENFGRRHFRMNFLDPWIILHEFVNNPNYALLRKTAKKHFDAKHLEYLSRARAWQAWNSLQQAESTKSEAARLCRNEWEAVCKIHPQLRELARPPKFKEKVWDIKRRYAPRAMAGKLLRTAGLRGPVRFIIGKLKHTSRSL